MLVPSKDFITKRYPGINVFASSIDRDWRSRLPERFTADEKESSIIENSRHNRNMSKFSNYCCLALPPPPRSFRAAVLSSLESRDKSNARGRSASEEARGFDRATVIDRSTSKIPRSSTVFSSYLPMLASLHSAHATQYANFYARIYIHIYIYIISSQQHVIKSDALFFFIQRKRFERRSCDVSLSFSLSLSLRIFFRHYISFFLSFSLTLFSFHPSTLSVSLSLSLSFTQHSQHFFFLCKNFYSPFFFFACLFPFVSFASLI